MSARLRGTFCGCGHAIKDHDEDRCREVWRYPDVMTPRKCGCKGPWQPVEGDSRYSRWADRERAYLDEDRAS